MSRKPSPAALLLLLLLVAGAARADTITFREGSLLPSGATYAGTLDTELLGSDPDASFGSSVEFRVDADHLGAEVQSLLFFGNIFGSLPDQIPLGSIIVSAVLELEVFNSSNSPVGNISVYAMTTGWDESSTWNSLGSGVQIGSETVASPDDSHTVEALGETTFDVLGSLQAWAGGASNLGWLLVNDSTDGVVFSSSEYLATVQRPTLTVVFFEAPEPGSLVLAGLAGAAALCARRRARRQL